MRLASTIVAAALLALPLAATAQTTTVVDQTNVVEKSTTVVVKEVPKPSPVTFTPYGFFLLNAFFNDAFGARNYPLPTPCARAACEGNILIDVRQTRLGARLAFDDTAGWTGATLSALVEVDFNGGYTTTTNSGAFYNPIVRLRKAYADAAWGTESKLTLRLGQDDRLISPYRPVSLAYVANPLFQNAGLLHGRAPMVMVRYDLTPKNGIGFTVGVAAINPQNGNEENGTAAGTLPSVAVDLGAGNRSRIPNFEGRVGLAWRSDGRNLVALGGYGGWQKNRYTSPATDQSVDQNSYIYGGDLDINFGFVRAWGNIYKGFGYDVPGALNSQGIALTVSPSVASCATPARCNITATTAVPAFGGWAQLLVGPPQYFQVYGGWGGVQTPFNALTGTVLGVNAARVQNFMWAAGAVVYAGKNWRFSAEYGRATSYFYTGVPWTQGQFSVNSQLVF